MILSGEASEMRMASKSMRSVVFVSVKLGLIVSLFPTRARSSRRTRRTCRPGLASPPRRIRQACVARPALPFSCPRHANALYLLKDRFAFRRRRRFGRTLLRRNQLDVQTERLQLADEHVERLRQTRRERRIALDDRFVDLGATGDVVGLR